MPVQTPRREYMALLPQWQMIRDCYAGSAAVKAAGAKYLPPLKSHISDSSRYTEYLKRALFYNAVKRTVQGLSGALHQKPPIIRVPPAIEPHLEDLTLSQQPAAMFIQAITEEILISGRAMLLIEFPADTEDIKLEQRRPYWCLYTAENIISWKTTRIGGDEKPTQVVLREYRELPDPKDPFSWKSDEVYRVLRLDAGTYSQELWSRPEGNGDYVREGAVIPQRRGAPLPFIPCVFFGPSSQSADPQPPPLLDLAEVNISHFRGSADLKHGLHLAALPTPWAAGSTASGGDTLQLGSGTVWLLPPGGQAGMLEVSGPGFDAIRTDQQDMQKMMATLGARLLEEQPTGVETATAVSMRHAGEQATLRTIGQAVMLGTKRALQIHSWWFGTGVNPADEDVNVALDMDFLNVRAGSEDVKAALLMLQAEAISYQTFYELIKKGGWAREGVEAEDEREEIERTAPEPLPTEMPPNMRAANMAGEDDTDDEE